MKTPPRPDNWLASLLNLFFKLLYHQFAWTYDLVSWIVSVGMWKTWLLSALPYLSGPKILELGHGPGHLQKALNQKRLYSIGLDLSPQMGRLAQKRLAEADITPKLINGSAQSLPFPSSAFDQIIATFPTEYIVHPNTVSEIYRVLKPDGRAIIIPAAQITKRSPLHSTAAWLFRITSQSGKEIKKQYQNQLSSFEQAGFSLSQKTIQHPNSAVSLIIAAKKLTHRPLIAQT